MDRMFRIFYLGSGIGRRTTYNPSKNSTGILQLGDIHLVRNEFPAAALCYRNAISLDPDLVVAYKKTYSAIDPRWRNHIRMRIECSYGSSISH